jgi:hypothetical protein
LTTSLQASASKARIHSCRPLPCSSRNRQVVLRVAAGMALLQSLLLILPDPGHETASTASTSAVDARRRAAERLVPAGAAAVPDRARRPPLPHVLLGQPAQPVGGARRSGHRHPRPHRAVLQVLCGSACTAGALLLTLRATPAAMSQPVPACLPTSM